MNKKTQKALNDVYAGQMKKRKLAGKLSGQIEDTLAAHNLPPVLDNISKSRYQVELKRLKNYHPDIAIDITRFIDATDDISFTLARLAKEYDDVVVPETTSLIRALVDGTTFWDELFILPISTLVKLPDQKYRLVYDETEFKWDFLIDAFCTSNGIQDETDIWLLAYGNPRNRLTRSYDKEFFQLAHGEVGTCAELNYCLTEVSRMLDVAKNVGNDFFAKTMADLLADKNKIVKACANCKILKYELLLRDLIAPSYIFHPQFDEICEAVSAKAEMIKDYGVDCVQAIIDKITNSNTVEAHELPHLDVEMN